MSSKTNKIAKDMSTAAKQETKQVNYQIDVELSGVGIKTTYITVTGVPKDLPESYMITVKAAAEKQFAETLNQRMFFELYNKDKTSKDEHPKFYNINNIEWVEIKDIKEIN